MTIHNCSDYDKMSQLCSDSLVSSLKNTPDALLCTATGNSPMGVYKNLSRTYQNNPETFKSLRILKLDEWGGVPAMAPNSCESSIRENILAPLHISADRYISFESDPDSPVEECARIQKEIQKEGPIDICILGMGKNGHIGFNEPCDALTPHCHIAKLSKESLEHKMANGMQNTPSYGLTLGMAAILQSKKIMLLLTGVDKKKIIEELLSKQITTQLPASFLWLHHNVECYIDLNAV